MRRAKSSAVAVGAFTGCCAAAVASIFGWLGPLVKCGADNAAVCVVWPPIGSFAVWLMFVGCIAALAAWHIREWRRNPQACIRDN